MKFGVIADVHANGPALDAVLGELAERNIDAVACVGDIVGVLGSPSEVVARVMDRAEYVVYGNHDTRVFPNRDWMPVHDFEVVEYEHTVESLSDAEFDWLTSLPGMVTADGVILAHARPDSDAPEGGLEYDDPGVFPREYPGVASEVFNGEDSGVLLLGHTHDQHAVDVGKFDGQPDALVLNPGSVGFPFDHGTQYGEMDSPVGKASFAVVDTVSREYDLCSVEYDSSSVHDHLREHGILLDGGDSRR